MRDWLNNGSVKQGSKGCEYGYVNFSYVISKGRVII